MPEQIVSELEEDGILVVSLSRAPSNALTPRLRKELYERISTAINDHAVSGIVLHGNGTGFSAGVDFSEYDGPLAKPWVLDLCQLIENSPKPVVCALHGLVLGAGFELALAAHARVVSKDARISMSDVKLGLMPGSGGTQRLPRFMGAGKTLEFLLTGRVISGNDKSLSHVATKLTEGDPTDAAKQIARELVDRGHWRKASDETIGLSDPKGYQNSLAKVSEQLPKTNSVERDILNCVEAAQLLPFEQGIAFETTLFLERISSPEARGPRHMLMAKQLVANSAGQSSGRDFGEVVVLGANSLASYATVVGLAAGADVTVLLPTGADIGEITREILSKLKSAFPNSPDDEMQEKLRRLHLDNAAAELSNASLVLDTGEGQLRPDQSLKSEVIWVALKPELTVERIGPALRHDRFFHLEFHIREDRVCIAEWATSGALTRMLWRMCSRSCAPPAFLRSNRSRRPVILGIV